MQALLSSRSLTPLPHHHRVFELEAKSPSHTTPQLPPELIDRIIDYFHDSPEDLRACALVCRTWLAFSRFHIFYSIKLSLTKPPKRLQYQRLCSAVQRAPCLALCCQELFVSRVSPTYEPPEGFSEQSILEPSLPWLLRSFTNLRVLKIGDWSNLPPDIRNALQDVVAYPSLVHLEIFKVQFPTLNHFTRLLHHQLKRLCLRINWGGDDLRLPLGLELDGQISVERQPCRLEHLQLLGERDARFVDWLLGKQALIDISNIRALEVRHGLCTLGYRQDEQILRLLKTLGSSLEHLTLYAHENWYDAFTLGFHFHTQPYRGPTTQSIDYVHLPNLQTLSLATFIDRRTASHLVYIFSSLAMPRLQEVSLILRFFPQYYPPRVVEWSHWPELDRILNGQAYGSLRRVKFSWDMARASNSDAVLSAVINNFPLLISRGIVEH